MRTVPVNQSDGPLPDGREPLRMMSMVELLFGLNAPRNIFQLDRSLDDQLAPLTVADIGGKHCRD
jgi:hypothetical protein